MEFTDSLIAKSIIDGTRGPSAGWTSRYLSYNYMGRTRSRYTFPEYKMYYVLEASTTSLLGSIFRYINICGFQGTSALQNGDTNLIKVFAAASTIVLTVGAHRGLGEHISSLSSDEIRDAILLAWINQSIALISIGLGKLTIVAFLVRIQGYPQPRRSIFLWFVGYSNLIMNCGVVALIFNQCSPQAKLWYTTLPGSCPRRKLLRNLGYFQCGRPSP
jgi:hypothetical protein